MHVGSNLANLRVWGLGHLVLKGLGNVLGFSGELWGLQHV